MLTSHPSGAKPRVSPRHHLPDVQPRVRCGCWCQERHHSIRGGHQLEHSTRHCNRRRGERGRGGLTSDTEEEGGRGKPPVIRVCTWQGIDPEAQRNTVFRGCVHDACWSLQSLVCVCLTPQGHLYHCVLTPPSTSPPPHALATPHPFPLTTGCAAVRLWHPRC
jgi:hypothetical protein